MKLVKAHAAQPCSTACCRYKMQKQTLGHISILTGVFPKSNPTCSPRGKMAGGVDFVPGEAPEGVWGMESGGDGGCQRKNPICMGFLLWIKNYDHRGGSVVALIR